MQKVKREYGLQTRKVQAGPLRTDEQLQTAKRRARKLYDDLIQNYDCILMDDETYVKADFRQLPGQQFYTTTDPNLVPDTVKTKKTSKYASKYLVWQGICTCGLRTDFFVTIGTINSEIYQKECLQKRVKPFVDAHNGSVLFWPDLATAHYSRANVKWINDNEVMFVPKDLNPPNCPELRPIEKYWAIMKGHLLRSGSVARTIPQFRLKWKRAYAQADEKVVQNLMEGVKRKLRSFIRNS